MKKNYYIYGLVDPINNIIRYVGRTKDVFMRGYSHLYDKNNSKKYNWIKKLLEQNKKPQLIILEQCAEYSTSLIQEQFWINKHKENIFNKVVGGVRENAGRKKEDDKKRPITIYFRKSFVDEMGGINTLKEIIYKELETI